MNMFTLILPSLIKMRIQQVIFICRPSKIIILPE